LTAREQRECVDCIGHRWWQNRQGNWKNELCASLGIGSGTLDAESGFVNCSEAQLKTLARGLLRKVQEIEDRVASGDPVVVACNHGSNRSFFVVNLYFQKWHNLSYEQVRQLMTEPREGPDGPLKHARSQAEPREWLHERHRHHGRQHVPLMTRVSSENRWMPIGVEYSDIAPVAKLHEQEADELREELAAAEDDPGTASEPDDDECEPEPELPEAPCAACGHATPRCREYGSQTSCGHFQFLQLGENPRSEEVAQVIAMHASPSAGVPASPRSVARSWRDGAIRAGGRYGSLELRERQQARGGGTPPAALAKAKAAKAEAAKAKARRKDRAQPKPTGKNQGVRLNGLMSMTKVGLVAIVRSWRKVKGAFPIPARFKQYKGGKDNRRSGSTALTQITREDDLYAEWFIARYQNDHDTYVVPVRTRMRCHCHCHGNAS